MKNGLQAAKKFMARHWESSKITPRMIAEAQQWLKKREETKKTGSVSDESLSRKSRKRNSVKSRKSKNRKKSSKSEKKDVEAKTNSVAGDLKTIQEEIDDDDDSESGFFSYCC